ncbi:hypothetical protein ACF059_02875 [Streptomyces sp. NPDC016562]|uniref:hypothetical protein n=1 Tax=Streptomyces sp. NPDC016562 TaxID=3364966 RepID=UPI0037012459
MSAERNVRTNVAFYPPQGDGGAWCVTAECLERALGEAFAGASVECRVSGIRGASVLDFEIPLAPGVWIDGTASTAEPDCAYVVLTDVTADEAAAFGRWLRDSFVPAPHLVWFASSLAVANGEQGPWPLPAEGGSEVIAAELRRHLGSV